MNIGKKAFFLTAAAGSLVVSGAAGAMALGNTNSGWVAQSNHCDTNVGDVATVGGLAPTGDVNVGSDCINFTNRGAALQSNECETSTGVIAPIGAAAPTGDVNIGSKCANIAVED
ncbi:hypothetical protein [Streptomyces cucumeris]|uniref:hypothetical protein n=1 Tax=Streptomyces cucumeris TaxID=2962890 RepID=UPI0020C893A4|nr:hypothetical protein [Streptomyces sp. NEAU-Y11]MCP9206664.1 hypothetical protein [Streptomyces sp. NEAU-Y11]